jgi:ubiquinone/menaquinone biosynthesis C-methylase UbiE
MANQDKTSWGEVASWYDGVVESDDSYQTNIILPNLLRVMNISKVDNILDIACGQGFFSRAFHAAGATVAGVDIGEGLIEIAKQKSKDINFSIDSAETLSQLGDSRFNKASIVLALQNIEKIQDTFSSAWRVLRDDGKLYIVLNHPSFRIPSRSEWGFDVEKNIQYRRVDGYMSESKKEMIMNPGADPEEQKVTLSFHRPLQVYTKALFKAGFVITRIEEWGSHKESESGPRQKAEDKARKEFPMFMVLEAKKLI